MELNILSHRLKILTVKLNDIHHFMPAFVKICILKKSRCKFFSFTKTCQDFSIIIDFEGFSELSNVADKFTDAEVTWVPLTISLGAYNSCQILDVAKALIIPLADNDITIYSLSSYQTDFVLVRENDLDKVVKCLSPNCDVHADQGQINLDDDSRPRSKSICAPLSLTKNSLAESDCLRPITHKTFTPNNKFHVTSIDCELLHTITQPLLEVMFYELEEKSVGEPFFSFSIVDNDVSLVLEDSLLPMFSNGAIFVNDECWRMIKIGDIPNGLGFSECGIVAQISAPMVDAEISEYYISTFYYDYTLVPESKLELVKTMLENHRKKTEFISEIESQGDIRQ